MFSSRWRADSLLGAGPVVCMHRWRRRPTMGVTIGRRRPRRVLIGWARASAGRQTLRSSAGCVAVLIEVLLALHFVDVQIAEGWQLGSASTLSVLALLTSCPNINPCHALATNLQCTANGHYGQPMQDRGLAGSARRGAKLRFRSRLGGEKKHASMHSFTRSHVPSRSVHSEGRMSTRRLCTARPERGAGSGRDASAAAIWRWW